MKVLHIDTEKGWRGGQQQAVYLYQAMRDKFYDTLFITSCKSDLYHYLIENDLPVYHIPFWGEWDFLHGLKLALLARKRGYRILHLHSGHALAWGLWAKIFSPSLKLIAVRRVDFSIRKHCFSYLKYSSSLVDRIVAISENIKQVLLSDGIGSDKIATIHSGIDLEKFSRADQPVDFRERWGIPKDAVLIGTVAAFVGHKDYPTLLRAAAHLLKKNDKLYFMAVGEGRLLPEMKELADTLKITGNFIFTGFQKDVGKFLKSFDIFVMPSKEEGLGTSVLDAQAVGLPVVATTAGGLPEMIENRVNGILVEPQNPLQLSSAILDLALNPSERQNMGRKARESVKQFCITNTVAQNLLLYQELKNARL